MTIFAAVGVLCLIGLTLIFASAYHWRPTESL